MSDREPTPRDTNRRRRLGIILALEGANIVGGSIVVIGVWNTSGPWAAVTAIGILLIATGQFVERRLFLNGTYVSWWRQTDSGDHPHG